MNSISQNLNLNYEAQCSSDRLGIPEVIEIPHIRIQHKHIIYVSQSFFESLQVDIDVSSWLLVSFQKQDNFYVYLQLLGRGIPCYCRARIASM